MKYLKRFKLQEHNTAPDNFIRLDSIGHYLDPDEGLLYAMWKRGGYDHENPYDVSYDDTINNIGDDDMKIVDRYWLSTKEIVEKKINWELIETAKDISLDYLDLGYRLCIYVFIDDILCYTQIFSHVDNSEKWPKYFTNKINTIRNSNQLEYMVRLDKNGILHSGNSKELHSQLELYHPTEKIKSIGKNEW